MIKRMVYVDTDISLGTPGAEIDDFAALLMLLRSPQAALAGIGSVFGNAPVADVDTNLARLLSWLERPDIPSASGAAAPLQGNLDWFAEWQAGYGPTPPFDFPRPQQSSAELLIELARTHPRELTVLAIGPLTNLALALRQAPEIAGQVRRVVAMGGSFAASSPEFNIHCDPAAARAVLQAGWPITLLGMEITRQMSFPRAAFAALPEADPAMRLFKKQAAGWIDRVEAMGWEKDGCALHDAAAAAYLLRPELFETQKAVVEVIVEGSGELPAGATMLQAAGGNGEREADVVTRVDAQACRKLIWSFMR
jgi:purine nucleosidase